MYYLPTINNECCFIKTNFQAIHGNLSPKWRLLGKLGQENCDFKTHLDCVTRPWLNNSNETDSINLF